VSEINKPDSIITKEEGSLFSTENEKEVLISGATYRDFLIKITKVNS